MLSLDDQRLEPFGLDPRGQLASMATAPQPTCSELRQPVRPGQVDLSAGGMVFQRSRGLCSREIAELNPFEIHLDTGQVIRARGRSVWNRERLQAVRFVLMHDVDRLRIAEHLDRLVRLHQPLH